MVREQLTSWKAKRDRSEFEEIILVGVDDSGFESTFNFSTVIECLEFHVAKNDNDRYDPDAVKNEFLTQIRTKYGR